MKFQSVTFKRDPNIDLKKVHAIKAVRQITRMGLKESKDLVEGLIHTPKTIQLPNEISTESITIAQNYLQDSGVSAHYNATNNKLRNGIGRQIEGTATWSTMSGQYDLAQEMIAILAKYFPDGIKTDEEIEEEIEAQSQARDLYD